MAASFRDAAGGFEISVDEIAAEIAARGATRITISGGEPFEQAEELRSLLTTLRERGVDDAIVYSGFRGETLAKRHPWAPELISCLIDGAYRAGEPTDAPWKGSANQRAWVFAPRPGYAEWLNSAEKRLQIARDNGNVYLLGIPRGDDAKRLLDRRHI